MNAYEELRTRQQKEFDAFPIKWAFNSKQMDEAMKELGLQPGEYDKITSIGAGGFIRKTDSDAFDALLEKLNKELEDAVAADPTGEGFIYDMFKYELDNHEYGYTGSAQETLDALAMTMEEIEADERLKNGFLLATGKRRRK